MKKIYPFILFLIFLQNVFAQDTCLTAVPIGAALYAKNTINGPEIPSLLCESQYGAVPINRPPAGQWYVYTPIENRLHLQTLTSSRCNLAPTFYY